MPSSIMGILIPPNASLAILNLRIDLYPQNMRPVVPQTLQAARGVILRKWKSQESPNVSEVMLSVQLNHQYESLLAINALSCTKFDQI